MAIDDNSTDKAPRDSYAERLVKLIPAEITTAYVAVAAALNAPDGDPSHQHYLDNFLLYAFIILLVLVPLYLWFVRNVRSWTVLAASTLSFPIWAATVSASVLNDHWSIDPPVLSVVLILWTTILPLFVR